MTRKKSATDETIQIEYNRLLISLDKMVAEREKQGLSDQEWTSFLHSMNQFAERPNFPQSEKDFLVRIYDEVDRNETYSPENGSGNFLTLPTHRRYLDSSWVYKDPRYLNWVKGQIFNPAIPGRGTDLGLDLRRAIRLVPDSVLLQEFHEPIVNLLTKVSFASAMHVDASLPLDLRIRLANLYYREAFRSSSVEALVDGVSSNELLPLTRFGDSVSTLDSPEFKALPEPLQIEMTGIRRDIFAKIWENAGQFGLFDLLSSNENVDWPLIWKTLGISPESGARELNARVRKFCKGPDYKPMLQGFDRKKLELLFGPSWSRQQKSSSPTWPDSDLWRVFSEGSTLDDRELITLENTARNFFFRSYPSAYKAAYLSALHEVVQGKDLSSLKAEDFYRFHQQVLPQLLDPHALAAMDWGVPASAEESWAQEIDRLPIDPLAKQKLLTRLFIDNRARLSDLIAAAPGGPAQLGRTLPISFFDHGEVQPVPKAGFTDKSVVLDILKRNGVVASTLDLFHNKFSPENPREAFERMGHQKLFTVLSEFEPQISEDLDRLQKAPEDLASRRRKLWDFVVNVVDRGAGPRPFDDGRAVIDGYSSPGGRMASYSQADLKKGNSAAMRKIKEKIFETAERLDFSDEAEKKLFIRLTNTGPAKAADEFSKALFSAAKHCLECRHPPVLEFLS